jgi:proline iminopeptidase
VKTKTMKLGFLVAGLLVSCSLLVRAGQNRQTIEDGTVEKELRHLEAKWGEAVESNDADRIGRFFTDDFLFVGAGGILQDRKQHLEDFRSGRLKVKSVKIGKQTIHVYGNAAVVSSQVAVQGKFGDRDISGSYQFTDTWVKQTGHWLAAARQQTRVVAPPASAFGQRDIKVEEGKKTVNGVDLYFKAIGIGDTIIVLHGGPGLDHTELLPQYQQLAKDFRLLFYDQRACGKSDGSFDENSINVDTYVEDLDGIRRAFGIKKAKVLGYSWGGLLAMFYTIKHPEAVDKLILVDSAPASLTELQDFGKVLDQRRSDAEKKQLAEIRSSAEYLAGDPKVVRASNRLGFRAYCFDPDRAKDITVEFTPKSAKAFIEVGNLFDKTLFGPGYDIHAKLKGISCPTLIVHGDTDPIQPKFLKTVSDEIKGSRFVLLEKCGHFSHVEQPDGLFATIAKFARK